MIMPCMRVGRVAMVVAAPWSVLVLCSMFVRVVVRTGLAVLVLCGMLLCVVMRTGLAVLVGSAQCRD